MKFNSHSDIFCDLQISREWPEQVTLFLLVGKETVKKQVEASKSLSPPSQWRESYLTLTWQRQSAANSARGNKRKGKQTMRKKTVWERESRRQRKKGAKEGKQRPEAWKERWINNGEQWSEPEDEMLFWSKSLLLITKKNWHDESWRGSILYLCVCVLTGWKLRRCWESTKSL